jgi:hypothetical protein
MKLLLICISVIVITGACNKSTNSTESISQNDLAAANNMTARLGTMQLALNNLINAPDQSQRLFWDSAYHANDDLFWMSHNEYHHNSYEHDDHSHSWISYDPIVNHHHHHHHHYPGHLNDSLVTTTNNHHHTTCHHHPGHHICHHHTLDSLHQVHDHYHP